MTRQRLQDAALIALAVIAVLAIAIVAALNPGVSTRRAVEHVSTAH